MDEVGGPEYKVTGKITVPAVDSQPNNPLLPPIYISENLPCDIDYPDGPTSPAVRSQDDESSDDDKHREKQWGKENGKGERPHKVKCREKQLFINGETRVCEIKTFTYYFKDEKIKQHYIIRIKGSTDITGYTGLRPYDEIILVSGVRLKGMKQKDVIKLVKEIKPKPGEDTIDLTLEFRRWKDANNSSVRARSASQDKNTDPVQSTITTIRLDLQLQPASDKGSGGSIIRKRKEAKKSEQPLPKGNVINITFEPPGKACIKVLASKGSYLLASDNGSISVGLLDNNDSRFQSKSEFDITPFQGRDDSVMPDELCVFGYIIHLTVDGVTMYLTSCLSNGSNRLVFKQFSGDPDQNSPDERFFLIHKYGDKTIMESMLYRGNCVHFDAASSTTQQSLNMKCIGSMTDDKCGEFFLNVFRTNLTSKLLRHFRENMNCLLPIRTTDR